MPARVIWWKYLCFSLHYFCTFIKIKSLHMWIFSELSSSPLIYLPSATGPCWPLLLQPWNKSSTNIVVILQLCSFSKLLWIFWGHLHFHVNCIISLFASLHFLYLCLWFFFFFFLFLVMGRTMQPGLSWNIRSSCLSFLSARRQEYAIIPIF